VVISKDGCTHKLIIENCNDSDAGLYHFEVNGCKTEAMVRVGGNYNSIFFFYIWLKHNEVTVSLEITIMFSAVYCFCFPRSSRIRPRRFAKVL